MADKTTGVMGQRPPSGRRPWRRSDGEAASSTEKLWVVSVGRRAPKEEKDGLNKSGTGPAFASAGPNLNSLKQAPNRQSDAPRGEEKCGPGEWGTSQARCG